MSEHKTPGASKGLGYKKDQPPKKLPGRYYPAGTKYPRGIIQTLTGACYRVEDTGTWWRVKDVAF